MSEFHKAIRWLQNGEIQLLFFIVGYSGDSIQIPEIENQDGQSSAFYDYSEDSTYPVALLEIRAKNKTEDQNVENIIRRVFSEFSGGSEIVICMFDGSYLSSEDLVDKDNIRHIYAFKTPNDEMLGISDDHRYSDAWKTDVRAVQRQIVRNYRKTA